MNCFGINHRIVLAGRFIEAVALSGFFFQSFFLFDLRVAVGVIIYNIRGSFNDVPNQTAEALLLLLLGID